jgi:hypothetical protein
MHKPSRFARMKREGGAVSLSDEWRAWLAENVAIGVGDAELCAVLATAGVARAIALREIDAVRRSPLTLGARRLADRVRRYELAVRLRREVARTARDPTRIERRSNVSADEFFDRYYAGQTPVVITDALAPWPRVRSWSPPSIGDRFGDAEIAIMAGREGPRGQAEIEGRTTKARVREFCDRVMKADPTNDFYLVANNHVLFTSALRALLEDVAAPHPYLEERGEARWMSLWIGPAGTVTPMHHDTCNALFCQIYGRKRVRLVMPFELPMMDAIRSRFYSARAEANDDVLVQETILEPGEALFLPVGTWHEVHALEPSISMSCTGLARANAYPWYTPGDVGRPARAQAVAGGVRARKA